jgi:phosphatidylinositol glycan class B
LENQKFNLKVLKVSFAFHLLAAFFSVGFHHFDEHFQILEFLNYKLLGSPMKDLPWEFEAQMRPWTQVYIYGAFYKVFNFFGLSSPFYHTLIFRVVCSRFWLYSVYRLLPVLKKWFSPEGQKVAWLLLNLSWFVPYIHTRTSAESFGISFFLLGLSEFFSPENKTKGNALRAGLFFGLSYMCKVQMAICVAFVWFWEIICGERKVTLLGLSAFVIAMMIGAGVLVDYFGYGNWTFGVWNNYMSNFKGGIFDRVRHYPWYWYFRWALFRGIPPVSLVILLATIFGWVKFWKHPLTWATLPLFVFHSSLGHKELRYVFPSIVLSVLFIPLWMDHKGWTWNELKKIAWKRRTIKFVLGVNFLFLMIASLRAANPAPKFYQYIWKHNISHFHAEGENPYTMLGLNINWYKKDELKVVVHKTIDSLPKGESYQFFKSGNSLMKWNQDKRCELLYLSYPLWAIKYLNIGGWVKRSRVWSLFKCNEP